MKKELSKVSEKLIRDSLASGTVESRVFQNKNNKQFNLPVMKRHTSPELINNIFNNKNVVGLKFKITDVILRDNIGTDVIFKKGKESRETLVHPFVGQSPCTNKIREEKGGRT